VSVKTDRASYVLAGVHGTFTLTIDPKNDERAHLFHIKTTAGTYDLGEAKNQSLPKFDFDVWVSRDGKKVSHNFESSFLFGRDQ